MTTFQEPPLQSRRAVRESERAGSTSGAPSRPVGGGEPLSYVTQNRPLLPGYDAPPMRGRRAADPAAPAAASAEPQPEAPAFRVRDYSPEARRAAPAWEVTEDAPGGGVVEYHTQARAAVTPPLEEHAPAPAPEAPAPEAPAPEAPASEAPASGAPAAEGSASPAPASPAPASLASTLNQPSAPSELTLTRRELRALREAHGITAVPTDATPVSAAESPAPAAFDALAGAERPRSGRRAAPQPESATGNFESLFTPPAQVAEPVSPGSLPPAAPSAFAPAQPTSAAPPPELREPAPAFEEPTAVVPEPDRPAAVTPAPFPSVSPQTPPAAPFVSERPVGHWTTQADLDDRAQVGEPTASRRMGSGGLTTNALVLPSLPGQDFSTGGIRVTGSIALPHSMSSMGAHPSQVDESDLDLDHLLDPGDHQVVSTDSIPIRATRAVSSHTSSRGIISAVKPRGNRALTALIVSAAGMAVVVVTLLVVALAMNVL